MLSREDKILTELMVARGVTSREAIERCARVMEGSPQPISLVDALIDSGEVEPGQATLIAEEARALDDAIEPSLPGGGKLGEFRLVREIGRGGMGIVFEAIQESLGRRVAIKILPAGAALDERLATRFLREARAAGKLQHPGIVPIISTGRAEGVLYFAMELIEGHSLGEEVARGPVAPERAAQIVAQVAHAVEHAHEAGFIHRDIKPENILMGADDRPRLTDFGLVHESLAESFTLSLHVLGTPAYISPEQALGESVDPRWDVYSLGAVLYALLCGRAPYSGSVPFLVLARVVEGDPPPLATVRPGVPAGLAAICQRAMARRPEERYARASLMASDLERYLRGEPLDVAAEVPEPTIVHAGVPERRRVSWKATLSIGAILLAAVVTFILMDPSSAERSDATKLTPHASSAGNFRLVNRTPGFKRAVSLSSDGKRLVYMNVVQINKEHYLYSQTLPDGPVVFPTEPGTLPGPASLSPDGKSLAASGFTWVGTRANFFLNLVSLEDHSVRRLAPVGGPATWSPDSRELVVNEGVYAHPRYWSSRSDSRLMAIDVGTGQVRVMRSGSLSAPSYSPHGRRIAFALRSGGQIDLWTIARGSEEMIRATDDPEPDGNPVWSSNGKFLYFGSMRAGRRGVYQLAIDEETGRPRGEPELFMDAAFAADFFLALSGDGRTMAVAQLPERGLLVRLDLASEGSSLSSPPAFFRRFNASIESPSPSPDGQMLAVAARSTHEDIAILSADGEAEPHLLTDDKFRDGGARWSPDGARIAFHSDRSGSMEIWTIRPDGSDLRQVTRTQDGSAMFPVWSPQSDRIAYGVENKGAFVISTSEDMGRIQEVPSATSFAPQPEPPAGQAPSESPFVPWSWSPDGTALAGTADGIVVYEIERRRYRRLTRSGEKPVWLPDGRRLLYLDDRKIHLLSASTGESRVVYSAEPSELGLSISLTSDGHAIYATLVSSGEEIWIAKIED